MSLPVGVEAPDQQPEEPVSGLEVRARTGTERDLELVPQKQVLDQQVAPLPEELCQRGVENAEAFEHPGRIADPAGSSFAVLQHVFTGGLRPSRPRAFVDRG